MPMLIVFVRRNGKIHHFWSSEMLFPPPGAARTIAMST